MSWTAEERREYMRRYRERNKDKVAEQQRRYYERNKDKVAEQQRRYRERNKDKVAEQQRRYRERNKDKVAEQQRRYRERNKDKVAEQQRRHRQREELETRIARGEKLCWECGEEMTRLPPDGLCGACRAEGKGQEALAAGICDARSQCLTTN